MEPYPWGHSRRFNSYTEYIRRTFGGRMQKVVVDAGFTCPNRDGSKGIGGCTYCNNDAFNPSYCNPKESIASQVEKGIMFHHVRYRKAAMYLVYFQPYSNTYASLDVLRSHFAEALNCPGVTGLVLGTRPDCLDDGKINYLAELARKYYIQVEFGVESCNERTLERINRCHSYAESVEMIRKTSAAGIHTGAHFIFGLPGESVEDMLAYAPVISGLPVDSVKFHQLQIVRGTRMEKEFIEEPSAFHTFTLEGYISFLAEFIGKLNPGIVIERISGEIPPRYLHHSAWGLIRYDAVLRLLEKELERQDTWQGRYYT